MHAHPQTRHSRPAIPKAQGVLSVLERRDRFQIHAKVKE